MDINKQKDSISLEQIEEAAQDVVKCIELVGGNKEHIGFIKFMVRRVCEDQNIARFFCKNYSLLRAELVKLNDPKINQILSKYPSSYL